MQSRTTVTRYRLSTRQNLPMWLAMSARQPKVKLAVHWMLPPVLALSGLPPPAERAAILIRAAELMENQMQTLMGILVREAGKTFSNAIAEVREAVDFLHYYAGIVRDNFANDSHRPLGPVVCISPWNFPLAIFTGQVAAALAAGNSVLAKPAEQTPLIAAQAVRILLDAGIPQGVLQLLPGRGDSVGALLVNDARVRAVMFTGSTEVATILQRSIAGRLDPQGVQHR